MNEPEAIVVGTVCVTALLVLLGIAASCHVYSADAIKACAEACHGRVQHAATGECRCQD